MCGISTIWLLLLWGRCVWLLLLLWILDSVISLVQFPYSTYLSSIISISFHYSTYFSSIFSILFHYSTYFSSIFSLSFHYFLLYFPNLFTIRLTRYLSSIFSKSFHYSTYLSFIFSNVFQLSETSINSYDISFMYKLPRYSWNIVESSVKHHKSNPLFTKTYTYLPIYLHFYQNYRFYSIFTSYFPILMSFKFAQSNLFYITA